MSGKVALAAATAAFSAAPRNLPISFTSEILSDLTKRLASKLCPPPFVIESFEREAAILLPFCHDLDNFNEPSVLFTVRSKALRNHGGEVR